MSDNSDEVNQIKLAVSCGVVGRMKRTNPLRAASESNTAKEKLDVMRLNMFGVFFNVSISKV